MTHNSTRLFLATLATLLFVALVQAGTLYDIKVAEYSGAAYTGDKTLSGTEVTAATQKTFAVQFDASKQTTDRMDLGVGQSTGIAMSNGFTLFFRSNNNTKDGLPDLGIYFNPGTGFVEKPVLERRKGNMLYANGQADVSYGMIVSPKLMRAWVYEGDTLITKINLKDYGINTLTGSNVLAGSYPSWENSYVSNFSMGSVYEATPVGSSKIIGSLDYSDTFTVTGTRTTMGNVENSYGNPARAWVLPNTNQKIGSGTATYGDSGAGSAEGYSYAASDESKAFIEYDNLRDQFIVQMDAVQCSDRVGICIGTQTGISQGDSGFSIFFRADGWKSTNPVNPGQEDAVGIYYNNKEYILVPKESNLINGDWNNYAVRVDTINNELELFGNGFSLGTFDLKNIQANTWGGGTTISKCSVKSVNAQYIGFLNNPQSPVDNFQVGTVNAKGVTAGKSALTVANRENLLTGTAKEYTETFRSDGTFVKDQFPITPTNTWYDNGKKLNAFAVEFDTTSQYYGSQEADRYKAVMGNVRGQAGTMAGSATGVCLLGNGVLYTMGLSNTGDKPTYILVQSDVVQPNGEFKFRIGESSTNYVDIAFGTSAITLYDEKGKLDINIDPSELLDVNHWGNYAVDYNADENTLGIYINEEQVGDRVSLADSGLDFIDYLGMISAALEKSLSTDPSLGVIDNFQVLTGVLKNSNNVPEPATWILLALGTGLLFWKRNRKGEAA